MNRILAAVIFFGLAVPVHAQVGVPRSGPAGGTIFHISFETSPAHLVAHRVDVQRDLKLSAAQVARIGAIVEHQERDELRGNPKIWALLAPVLSPVQRQRVKMLSIKALGPYAALVPDLRGDLGLTAGQQKRLDNVKRVYLLAQDKGLAESMMGKLAPDAERQERSRMQMQALLGGINSTLTTAQKNKLRSIERSTFVFNPPIKRNGMVVWMPAFGMR